MQSMMQRKLDVYAEPQVHEITVREAAVPSLLTDLLALPSKLPEAATALPAPTEEMVTTCACGDTNGCILRYSIPKRLANRSLTDDELAERVDLVNAQRAARNG